MSNHSYEIEIKSLLGNKETAEKLVGKMKEKDSGLQEIGSHKQLNHYFVPAGGDLKKLFGNVKDVIEPEKIDKLSNLAEHAKDFSVRTRWADGKVILVVKASVDDTTSFNGTARLEWESFVYPPSPLEGEGAHRADEGVKKMMPIEELDQLVLDSGFQYQAKWSRERSDYKYHPTPTEEISVSIDKNAGYGFLAEFEMVADDQAKADGLKSRIREIMKELEAEELMQDRLERMFAYYNANWHDYYGTEKVFNVE